MPDTHRCIASTAEPRGGTDGLSCRLPLTTRPKARNEKHEGQDYFSMAYVQGSDLAELAREGPIPPRRAAELLKAIAEAIHYAHQRGVLHRDLKPCNVLLDEFGQPACNAARSAAALRKHFSFELKPLPQGPTVGSTTDPDSVS